MHRKYRSSSNIDLSGLVLRHHSHCVKDIIKEEMQYIQRLLKRIAATEWDQRADKPRRLVREAHNRLKEAQEFLHHHRLMVDEEDQIEGRNVELKLKEIHTRLLRQLGEDKDEHISTRSDVNDQRRADLITLGFCIKNEHEDYDQDDGESETLFQRLKHMSLSRNHDANEPVSGESMFQVLKRHSYTFGTRTA